jgi:clan AA aspartic protease
MSPRVPLHGTQMGETYAKLTLTNPFNGKSVAIRALVDTGASHLILSGGVARLLGYDPEEVMRQNIGLADGRWVSAPFLQCLQMQFEGRSCTTDAYVLPGDECLLGFIPLELMDLIVDPKQQALVYRHPDGPVFLLGGRPVRVVPMA